MQASVHYHYLGFGNWDSSALGYGELSEVFLGGMGHLALYWAGSQRTDIGDHYHPINKISETKANGLIYLLFPDRPDPGMLVEGKAALGIRGTW